MTPEEFKQLRLSLGLTQREMAKAMGGINYRTVQRFETGEIKVERMALRVCEYLKIYGELK